jgi:phosphate-selective porin/cell division protein FtsB
LHEKLDIDVSPCYEVSATRGNFSRRGEKMRLLKMFCALLAVLCFAPVPLLRAQSDKPADDSAQSKPATKAASEEEVQQLRREVAALRAQIQKLVEAKGQPEAAAHLVEANAVVTAAPAPGPDSSSPADAEPDPTEISPGAIALIQGQKKSSAAPVTAGWNGEHFFIKSTDGQFQIQPYGYVDTDYRAYAIGDGTPPDTFLLRRGRFGFQGNYGSHFQFGILSEVVTGSGAVVRDIYLNAKVDNQFQVQFGQFKVPFGQESAIGATNLDFVERGFQSMLYSSAASAYRSPGAVAHGDLFNGTVQYFVGGFNGKGYAVVNTTNQPEVLGRLRLIPFRNRQGSFLQNFLIGGSIDRGRSRGLSNEVSFSGNLPDAAYNFFPQFRINGPIERYNGDITFLKGPWSIRGEYVQMNEHRDGVGTLTLGGLGFSSFPGIIAKAWDLSGTFLLTGEKRPENGAPRVTHPFFGPETEGKGRGIGAWELAFRYTGIQAKEPGVDLTTAFTPQFLPTFDNRTDEFTFGINWYPNYWVRYMFNVAVDQLVQPSSIGNINQNYFVFLNRIQFRF